MTTLSTASDLRTWMTARAQQPTGDAWLEAASALRRAALGVPDVSGLVETASFRTHGRRASVGGVALAPTLGGGVRADVGVRVSPDAATEPGRLGAVGRAVELAVAATWGRTGDGRSLDVTVHLVEVAAG